MIMVKFAKLDIPKAPFEILVAKRSTSPILAFGPGLQTGVVGYPAAFVVEMNGETGNITNYDGEYIPILLFSFKPNITLSMITSMFVTGSLGFSVAGPSQAEIECHDNGDGSALVKYATEKKKKTNPLIFVTQQAR